MAALHHRPGRDGEVLAARGFAAIATGDFGGVMVGRATMWADRAVRPADVLEPSPSGVFIVEVAF